MRIVYVRELVVDGVIRKMDVFVFRIGSCRVFFFFFFFKQKTAYEITV